MQNSAQKIAIFLPFALLNLSTALGATVTLGSANSGNCYPFNCNDSGSASGQSIRYQQVFSGAQFGSSPFTISNITFSDLFLPSLGFSSVPLLSGTYTFSFAITNKAVGALSTNLSSNVTSGLATFLTTTTAGVGAGFTTLSFNGSTAYVYNPASGNLLLDIVVTNQANVTSASYDFANGMDADDTGAVTSRAFQIGGSTAADNTGLVTTFNTSIVSTQTPEPTTFALIGGGLLAFFGWKRRKALSGGIAMCVIVLASLPTNASAQAPQGRTIAIPLHTLDGTPVRLNGAHRAISNRAAITIVSVPTFSRSYTIDGTVYPQTFVGSDPATSNITTNITVPVIPVIIVLNDGAGPTYDPTKKLTSAPGGSALSATLATLTSPIFQNANYTTGGTNVGNGIQFGDAIMRATFWDSVSSTSPNWHTVLKFQLKPAVTLRVPAISGVTAGPLAEVNLTWLGNKLDSLAPLYGSTNFPIFLFYQVVETQDNGGCCVLGFHTAIQTGPNLQSYAMGTYIEPGTFGQSSDVSVLSHEVAEWLNDPFVGNIVPNWPGPFTFVPPGPPYSTQCQNNLETGDPIEDRSDPAKLNFHITTFGRPYTLQNEALAPWFLHISPSFSVNGYYTYLGPIDNEFTSFAPACTPPLG